VFKNNFSPYLFSSLIDTISDEIGCIGESCGRLVVRIPEIARETVMTTMTRIYRQINFADNAVTRAMEALSPILLYYYTRYLTGDRLRERLKPGVEAYGHGLAPHHLHHSGLAHHASHSVHNLTNHARSFHG